MSLILQVLADYVLNQTITNAEFTAFLQTIVSGQSLHFESSNSFKSVFWWVKFCGLWNISLNLLLQHICICTIFIPRARFCRSKSSNFQVPKQQINFLKITSTLAVVLVLGLLTRSDALSVPFLKVPLWCIYFYHPSLLHCLPSHLHFCCAATGPPDSIHQAYQIGFFKYISHTGTLVMLHSEFRLPGLHPVPSTCMH